MKRIKVVHYGIAHDHSSVTLGCALKHPDIYEVAGICEPDEETRRTFGHLPEYQGLPWITEDELFARDDISAVFCEGHELRSVSDAQKAIDHGLHVHLDKPGGIDIAAFEKLLKDADDQNLTLQMGYMYRYNPAMRYVLDSVKSGRFGTITGIDGSFSFLHNEEKRQWLAQFPGGMMFFIGCHIIDMIMLINGVPERVSGFNHSSGYDNRDSKDTAFAVLDYPNGACSVRSNATEVNGYAHRRLLVVGTKGSMEIRPLECPTIIREAGFSDTPPAGIQDTSRIVFPGYLSGRYDDMLLEFASCVRGEMKNPYSSRYEIDLQKVILAACR